MQRWKEINCEWLIYFAFRASLGANMRPHELVAYLFTIFIVRWPFRPADVTDQGNTVITDLHFLVHICVRGTIYLRRICATESSRIAIRCTYVNTRAQYCICINRLRSVNHLSRTICQLYILEPFNCDTALIASRIAYILDWYSGIF